MSTAETMDQQAMMEKWAKFATPGPAHERFKKLVGKWNANVKFWFTPDAPPSESQGISTFKLIFGGRYMVQEFEGTAMGQPFTGMGISGFDNFRREYFDTWLDSMGTSIMVSWGTETNGTVEFKGTVDDFMTDRRDVPARSVASWIDDNTHKVEMFCVAPNGQEFQNMEIIFTRA